jgi:hypothetical protein
MKMIEDPKARPAEICMLVYAVREKVKTESTPRDSNRPKEKECDTNHPTRGAFILGAERIYK